MAVGPTQQSVVRPARGTRPSNRRQLIIDAPTDSFSRKGYANVAMGDVAEAAAIGPSALYRHFRGKQDLLATVVEAALHPGVDLLRLAGPAGGTLAARSRGRRAVGHDRRDPR